ncbi:uncharacterized protein LOC141850153 [Brevipalpus obovatus]|uniref:uncharacterized protein LOC141850153 n=1 Tax=Brevipalpus obovatus TaxID=246614 RepID=UPI003D9E3B55
MSNQKDYNQIKYDDDSSDLPKKIRPIGLHLPDQYRLRAWSTVRRKWIRSRYWITIDVDNDNVHYKSLVREKSGKSSTSSCTINNYACMPVKNSNSRPYSVTRQRHSSCLYIRQPKVNNYNNNNNNNNSVANNLQHKPESRSKLTMLLMMIPSLVMMFYWQNKFNSSSSNVINADGSTISPEHALGLLGGKGFNHFRQFPGFPGGLHPGSFRDPHLIPDNPDDEDGDGPPLPSFEPSHQPNTDQDKLNRDNHESREDSTNESSHFHESKLDEYKKLDYKLILCWDKCENVNPSNSTNEPSLSTDFNGKFIDLKCFESKCLLANDHNLSEISDAIIFRKSLTITDAASGPLILNRKPEQQWILHKSDDLCNNVSNNSFGDDESGAVNSEAHLKNGHQNSDTNSIVYNITWTSSSSSNKKKSSTSSTSSTSHDHTVLYRLKFLPKIWPSNRPIEWREFNVWRKKRKMVLFIRQNCSPDIRFDDFINELSNYIEVDTVDNCDHHIKFTHQTNNGDENGSNADTDTESVNIDRETFLHDIRDYFFILNLRAWMCPKYISDELLYTILNSSYTVPIVMDPHDSSSSSSTSISMIPHSGGSLLPIKSIINGYQFKSASELADYLLYVSSDLDEYSTYLHWKDHHWVMKIGMNESEDKDDDREDEVGKKENIQSLQRDAGDENDYCRLCGIIHGSEKVENERELMESQRSPSKDWCVHWSDTHWNQISSSI